MANSCPKNEPFFTWLVYASHHSVIGRRLSCISILLATVHPIYMVQLSNKNLNQKKKKIYINLLSCIQFYTSRLCSAISLASMRESTNL